MASISPGDHGERGPTGTGANMRWMSSPVTAEITSLFADVGARAYVHVHEIGVDAPAVVEVDADATVAVASVIKIPIAVAFARAVAEGTVDPAERAEVPARLRVGGTGTTGFSDPVTLSLRDLARLMMALSDNAATDVVLARVGRPAVQAVADDLGLSHTRLRASMEDGHFAAMAELGLTDSRDLDGQVQLADPGAVWRLAWLDPGRANCSTAREIGMLLSAIWTDRAGPSDACAFVRGVMAEQIIDARIPSGFAIDGVRVAGKTGTLPAIRNEAGVVSYPDGRSFAVAIFTRADSLSPRRPDIDAAIGRAARIAVDALRAGY